MLLQLNASCDRRMQSQWFVWGAEVQTRSLYFECSQGQPWRCVAKLAQVVCFRVREDGIGGAMSGSTAVRSAAIKTRRADIWLKRIVGSVGICRHQLVCWKEYFLSHYYIWILFCYKCTLRLLFVYPPPKFRGYITRKMPNYNFIR